MIIDTRKPRKNWQSIICDDLNIVGVMREERSNIVTSTVRSCVA